MPDLDVRALDPADESQVTAFWALTGDAGADRPYDLRWPLATVLAELRQVGGDARRRVLAAYAGDRMVGAVRIEEPLKDNTHCAVLELHVLPDVRRAGIGTGLLAAAERLVREAGRRTVLADVFAPPDADPPGVGFAAAAGFTLASEEGIKALDLTASAAGWPDAAAALAPHHPDHRLVAWRGATPDELVAGTCALYSRFLDEIPLGGLDLTAGAWDEARLREDEELDRLAGRRRFAVAAVAADDSVVGFTDLYVSDGGTRQAFIGGTLVVPGHRGHRLGAAMKLANQQQLHAAHPECEVLLTGNAGVNEAMNRVNTELGFRAVERCLEYQKAL